MEHEGSAMLQGRYVPLLQFKGRCGGVPARPRLACGATSSHTLAHAHIHTHHTTAAHASSARRMLPSAGVQHEELLLRLKVHRSAAGIAEAICSKASDLGADAVLIASHGAGALADFGSVSRWGQGACVCVATLAGCWGGSA